MPSPEKSQSTENIIGVEGKGRLSGFPGICP